MLQIKTDNALRLQAKRDQSLIDKFLEQLNSDETKRSYKTALIQFASYLMEVKVSIKDCDFDVIRSYMDFLLSEGKSSNTCAQRLAVMSKFFKFLIANNKIKSNPCEAVTISKTEPDTIALDENEVKTLKEIAKGDTTLSITNELILILGFNGGLRRAEIASIKFKDIKDADGGYLIDVTGKGKKKRVVAIDNRIGKYLFKLVSKYESMTGLKFTKNDYVIQSEGNDGIKRDKNKKPINTSSIYRRLVKLVDQANIDKPVTPHTMRSTLATAMDDRGIEITKIQKFLGHNDIATTMKYIKRNHAEKHALEIAIGY